VRLSTRYFVDYIVRLPSPKHLQRRKYLGTLVFEYTNHKGVAEDGSAEHNTDFEDGDFETYCSGVVWDEGILFLDICLSAGS
jgi:hypothetical protein